MFETVCLLCVALPLCALIHFFVIGFLSRQFMIVQQTFVRAKTLFALFCLFLSHLSHILVLTSVYYVLARLDLGYLEGFVETQATFLENLYFSSVSYTSLGFGEMYPVGMFRLVAGLEALFGLVMLGWTASYLFMFMNKHIEDFNAK